MTEAAQRTQALQTTRRATLFALAGFPVLVGLYFFVDRPVARFFGELDGSAVYSFFDFIELFGESRCYIVPGILAAIALRAYRSPSWRVPWFLALSAAVSGIVVNLLKFGFGRYRPIWYLDSGKFGFAFFELPASMRSFPSGHATTAFTIAMAMTLLLPRYRAGWFVIAAIIAAARVVTGAHYVSDIVAGAWLGTISVLVLAHYVSPVARAESDS